MARKQTFVDDMVKNRDDDEVAYYCSSASCANNNDDEDYMSESPLDYDEAYDNEMLTFDEASSCGAGVLISINGRPYAATPVAQPACYRNPEPPTTSPLQTHGKRPFHRASSFRSNDSDSDEESNSW